VPGESSKQKELRAESIPWFSPSPSVYNDSEVLFVACLIKISEYAKPSELLQWAAAALLEEPRVKELGDDWREPDQAEWTGTGKIVARMYWPLESACNWQWPSTQLEQVAKAMQVKAYTDQYSTDSRSRRYSTILEYILCPDG
jgi:hypothetical protein